MDWQDEGILLGGRRFGETGLILDVLTAQRGRRSGLVYGGASRRKKGQFEPGNSLHLNWIGRLEDQLGRFETAEPTKERAARILDDLEALTALSAIMSMLRGTLDEGDSGAASLFQPTLIVLDALEEPDLWPALYVRWELGLLAKLGFGLDLERCTLTGAESGLTHVSPKTGRAVRADAAEDYLDRLLILPSFLVGENGAPTHQDILNGLSLTGHFLENRVFASVNKPIPEARQRLVTRITQSAA